MEEHPVTDILFPGSQVAIRLSNHCMYPITGTWCFIPSPIKLFIENLNIIEDIVFSESYLALLKCGDFSRSDEMVDTCVQTILIYTLEIIRIIYD